MGWPNVAAGLLAWSCLPAQDVTPTTGAVRGLDGAVVADVIVHAVALDDRAPAGAAARLRARTARDGTFTLPLTAAVPHCVWALGATGADGGCRVAEPRIVVPGSTLQLVLAHRRAPTVLAVAGAAPWAGEGPLSVRVVGAGESQLCDDVPLRGDGPLRLPALPCARVALELRNARSEVLDVARVDVDATGPAVRFASPRDVDVRVEDASGAAVGGARVVQTHWSGSQQLRPWRHDEIAREHVRELAVTGADGTARVRVAVYEADQGSVVLRAVRAGQRGAASGWAGAMRIVAGRPDATDGALRLVLASDDATTVRVRGELAADLHLIVREQLPFGQFPLPSARPLRHAGGAWELAAAPGALAYAVALPRPGGTAPLLPVRLPWPMPADVDLASLRRFEVRCVGDAGRSASGVELAIGVDGYPPSWFGTRVADERGHATLLVPPGNWLVCAVTGDASALAVVAAGSAPGVIELRLLPLAVRRLRVVDGGGKPVAGARVRADGSAGSHPGRPSGAAQLALAKTEFAPEEWRWAGCTSDERGALELRYLALPRGALRLRAERDGAVSTPFPLVGEDVATVVLEPRR
jgi:hypothetical protein